MKRHRAFMNDDTATSPSSSPENSGSSSYPACMSDLVMPEPAVPYSSLSGHNHNNSNDTPSETDAVDLPVKINPIVRCMVRDRIDHYSVAELLKYQQREGGVPISDMHSELTPMLGPVPATAAPHALLSPMMLPQITPDSITTPNTLPQAMPLHLKTDPGTSAATFLFNTLVRTYDDIDNSIPMMDTADGKQRVAQALIAVCRRLSDRYRSQPVFFSLRAPSYVIGDIHGNFRDLRYFISNMVPFMDPTLAVNNVLFLGDYVDRGVHGFACVATLFAMRLLNPDYIHLLRGNHEDTVVCGDLSTYGSESFKAELHAMFGSALGEEVLQACLEVFTHLPIACDITVPRSGRRILCTHGGIPRFRGPPTDDDGMRTLKDPNFPHFPTLFTQSLYDEGPDGPSAEEKERIVKCWVAALDVMWSDPTPDDHPDHLDESGFSRNMRGDAVVSFSSRAVNAFLAAHGYDMLLRAHQEKSLGLRVSKSSRVVTIFSTSNYQGGSNSAGCAFVDAKGSVNLILRNEG
eukprot:PhM_4_TR10917/c0_g1_i2/m.44086